ncbi:MAG: toll/interleukin-1 receptor domain-containing protein [Nocardioidaceae bacterium]
MDDLDGKHVFISYVHEDAERVDGLCAVLEAAQIPYWRDRSALGPGDAWRAKIRQAIRGGSLVFLACFSDKSRSKDRSYMNEELTLAVDEFRKMPPGRTWLIPVRFDDGDVPEWDLGAGLLLSDLNYSDLFGPGRTAEAAKLVTTIHRVMGDKRLGTASALAAVEQATATGRTDLLRRLTKEMLLDASRRIELDDLISQEVRRVMAVLNDPSRTAGPFVGSNDELVVRLAREAQELWALTEPFCASLQVAARWGTPEVLAPWANGLRSFVAVANRTEGGVQALTELRHLPGMVGIMTAGLACVSSRKWENLKTLVVDSTVRDRYEERPVPILEATSPYKPFGTNDWVANTLARAAQHEKDPEEALKDFTERRQGKYRSPAAEWLHTVLRALFLEQWPDQDAYDAEFDRAEVMLGGLAQDAANMRASGNPNGRAWVRSHWYGRSTWRAAHYHGNAAEDVVHELSQQGQLWGPLQASLFGADEERAKAATEAYLISFNKISAEQRF